MQHAKNQQYARCDKLISMANQKYWRVQNVLVHLSNVKQSCWILHRSTTLPSRSLYFYEKKRKLVSVIAHERRNSRELSLQISTILNYVPRWYLSLELVLTLGRRYHNASMKIVAPIQRTCTPVLQLSILAPPNPPPAPVLPSL